MEAKLQLRCGAINRERRCSWVFVPVEVLLQPGQQRPLGFAGLPIRSAIFLLHLEQARSRMRSAREATESTLAALLCTGPMPCCSSAADAQISWLAVCCFIVPISEPMVKHV